jgi:hypothetical protein
MTAGVHNVKMDINKFIRGFLKIINNFMNAKKEFDDYILFKSFIII